MPRAQSIAALDDGSVEVMVSPGDEVVPGTLLYVITPDDGGGCTTEVASQGFGWVRQYEASANGKSHGLNSDDLIGGMSFVPSFGWADDYDGAHVYVKKGTPLFVITPLEDGWEAGTIKGLTPRPTTVMKRREQKKLELAA